MSDYKDYVVLMIEHYPYKPGTILRGHIDDYGLTGAGRDFEPDPNLYSDNYPGFLFEFCVQPSSRRAWRKLSPLEVLAMQAE